jgi:hypothetical protein
MRDYNEQLAAACARKMRQHRKQARNAQLQLNSVPGWILYVVGAWRDLAARIVAAGF